MRERERLQEAPATESEPATAAPDRRVQALMHRSMLQRKARRAEPAAPTQAVDRAAQSGGSPLPETLQHKFGGTLGADLSGVRVHTGAASAEAAESVEARAYTTGNDIHMGAGEYDPSSRAGQQLLAHEVVHTVQQSRGAGAAVQRKATNDAEGESGDEKEVSSPGDESEKEADTLAEEMTGGEQKEEASPAEAKKPPMPGKPKHKPGKESDKDKIADLEKQLAVERLHVKGEALLRTWQQLSSDKIHALAKSQRDGFINFIKQTGGNPNISSASVPRASLLAELRKTAASALVTKGVQELAKKYTDEVAKDAVKEGLIDAGSAVGAGTTGAEAGSAFGPAGTVVGFAAGVLLDMVVDRVYNAIFGNNDAEMEEALKKAAESGFAQGAKAAGDQIIQQVNAIDKDDEDAQQVLRDKIFVSGSEILSTWEPKELYPQIGRVEAQIEATNSVTIPDSSELTTYLLDKWVRDHAKTDQKPTDDVNETAWNEAPKNLGPELFVDQSYKAWGMNGLAPPEDLRREFREAAGGEPDPSIAVMEKFEHTVWHWKDVNLDLAGQKGPAKGDAWCMPQLELSPEGGVYVKEWLWKFHYKETDTEKKDVALPDDEKVSPTKLPAECQPGTFKAGDDSCDVKHDYDVEVYGNSEPGNEKVELHWDSSNRVDLGMEKAPPDPSEMVSRPDDDQQP